MNKKKSIVDEMVEENEQEEENDNQEDNTNDILREMMTVLKDQNKRLSKIEKNNTQNVKEIAEDITELEKKKVVEELKPLPIRTTMPTMSEINGYPQQLREPQSKKLEDNIVRMPNVEELPKIEVKQQSKTPIWTIILIYALLVIVFLCMLFIFLGPVACKGGLL